MGFDCMGVDSMAVDIMGMDRMGSDSMEVDIMEAEMTEMDSMGMDIIEVNIMEAEMAGMDTHGDEQHAAICTTIFNPKLINIWSNITVFRSCVISSETQMGTHRISKKYRQLFEILLGKIIAVQDTPPSRSSLG